ncbi:MAG: hypothetical protein IPK31_20645 [Chitinophagaceae bacterium]|nr:hypothetical protein [Chitinophagaceae bacterium]
MKLPEASFRLNRQVENLLNMSRIERISATQKDWCDVGELLYEVTRRVEEERYTARRIEINLILHCH